MTEKTQRNTALARKNRPKDSYGDQLCGTVYEANGTKVELMHDRLNWILRWNGKDAGKRFYAKSSGLGPILRALVRWIEAQGWKLPMGLAAVVEANRRLEAEVERVARQMELVASVTRNA